MARRSVVGNQKRWKYQDVKRTPILRRWLSWVSAHRGSRTATREAADAQLVVRVGEIR